MEGKWSKGHGAGGVVGPEGRIVLSFEMHGTQEDLPSFFFPLRDPIPVSVPLYQVN